MGEKTEEVIMEHSIQLYKDKKDCCGCSACVAVCPVKALRMVVDEEGFYYPELNENKCVKCYQCTKVCSLKNH